MHLCHYYKQNNTKNLATSKRDRGQILDKVDCRDESQQMKFLLIELIWLAPEVLRAYQPIPQGTQSGDVYSFSMVLYLLIFERIPYHGDELEGV